MEKNKKVNDAFAKRKATLAAAAAQETNSTDLAAKLIPKFDERFGKEVHEGWKKEHAPRQLIYLHADGKMAVLRPPTADDLGEYMTAIGANGLTKAVAFVMETLWIDGDYELIDDEDLFQGVFLQMNNILEGKKVDFFRA